MKSIKKHAIKFIVLIVVTAIMGVSQTSAQGPTDTSDGGDDTSDPFRRSDSPYMRIPAELMNAEPTIAPDIGSILEDTSGLPGEAVTYDMKTGQETRSPIEVNLTNLETDSVRSIAPYQGLLPEPPDDDDASESVIGADDRSRVTTTTSDPWRTIVRLYPKFPNGVTTICSGAIIDNFHVLTAGHCVHNPARGGWADEVRVVPGQDDDYTPYYSAWVTRQRSYTNWTDDRDVRHDWALLTLDRNMGTFVGWMGRQTADPTSSIYLGSKNVAGYPGDLGDGCCLYFDGDNAHSVDEYRHWYWMDTAGGMSGSPVWRLSSGTRYILTIHAYGVDSDASFPSNTVNSGTRLNEDKYDRILTWVGQDTAPTDRPDLIDDGPGFAGFSPTSVTAGASFSAYNDVRNVGTASSGSFYVSYYASTDQTIDTGDYLIGNKLVSSISPFQYRDSNWSGTFPTNIPPGTYYVGWLIDRTNTVIEFDGTNNDGIKTSPRLTVLPAAPTGLSASDGTYTDKVRVTWSSVSGAASYNVYRATSAGGSKTYLGNTTGTTYDDTSASPGTTYYYFVRAKAANGSLSSYSNSNTGYRAISPPTSVQASDGTYTDKVRVTWSSASGATTYTVYRATSANGAKTALGTTSSTSYDDTSASPGVTYYYFVKAKGTNGLLSDDYSNYNTGYRALTLPTNAQASDGADTDKVQVTWNSVSGATSYDVYRATSANGNKSLLDNVTGTTYDDTSATSGVTYYYFVKAKAANDSTSDFSSEDAGYRALTQPTNVQASDGDYSDKVAITWNSTPDAVSYEVYRATSENGNKTMLGNPTGVSYDDTSAITDTTYYYFVKAKGANASTSAFSDSDTGHRSPAGFAPDAPINVQASNGTYPDKVVVTWDAVDDATSYTIYRADSSGGDTTELGTITETTYEDMTVMQGVPYYYSVTAQNDFGSSQVSSEAMGQTGSSVYLPTVIK